MGGFLLKKIIAVIASICLALTSAIARGAAPASADLRVSSTVTGKTVFIGSPSTVTSSATISERASTSDWANVKCEINAIQKVSFSLLAVFNQQNTSPCGGTTATVSGSTVTCSVSVTASRTVLYASVANGTGSISTSLKVTQTSGASQLYRVRTWIDRNNNDQIDPYEPTSSVQSINTVDPRLGKAFYNFDVDPPRFTEGKVTGWIANAGTSNKATDLLDPTLISMKVHSCGSYSCTRISGATTYNYHPQLLRYEFTTNVPALTYGTYAVELYYQQDVNNLVLLETKTFDYKTRAPLGVTTEILPQAGTVQLATGMSAGISPRLRTTMASPGTSSFTYKATFKDDDKTLIANRPVYVIFNLTDIVSPSLLRVNGVQITPVLQDQVIIRRDTDATGVLTLNIQYTGRALEQLRIDLQINGLRPYEFAYPGSEEAFSWDTTPVRTIGLSASGTTATSANPFTLTATVSGSFGGAATDGSVLFYGDSGFTFDTPVVPLALGTSASTVLRISNFAGESGTGYVYAQTLSSSGWITAKLQISWKEYGNEVIVGEVKPIITLISDPKAAISVKGKVTFVTVSGLAPTDIVVINRGGILYSPTFNFEHSIATKTFSTSSKPSIFLVTVNGKTVLKAYSK